MRERESIYHAALQRIYRLFVVDENPPGVLNGPPAYHHGTADDPVRTDCPCAIGVLDDDRLLDTPALAIQKISVIGRKTPDLLASLLGVDEITEDDIAFLSLVQQKHDHHAVHLQAMPWRPVSTFHAEMADALQGIAREYGLARLSP